MGKGGNAIVASVEGGINLVAAKTTATNIGHNLTTELSTKFSNEKKNTIPGQSNFFWSSDDEPHHTRRMKILAKYPEIKQLYGHDPYLRYQVVGVVFLQIALSLYVREQPWWKFLLIAYVIGGTCNHMMLMALHELSHNLGFKRHMYNKYFAMFVANIPIGIPAAVTFKKYHMEHHRYQGVDGVDVDIPTPLEGRIFNNTFTKTLFVVFQICFYAIRPAFVNTKLPGQAEYLNAAAILLFDVVLTYVSTSLYPLLYLLLSTFLGGGMHPCAGHFIAEHYVFNSSARNGVPEAETYSYYGPINIFNFNVGYHNEHHDFPFVPGRRLPQVRKIAAEFYDPMPHHTSYFKVIYDYITDPSVTGFSRVKRKTTSALEASNVQSTERRKEHSS